jgi:hypothetical protein
MVTANLIRKLLGTCGRDGAYFQEVEIQGG